MSKSSESDLQSKNLSVARLVHTPKHASDCILVYECGDNPTEFCRVVIDSRGEEVARTTAKLIVESLKFSAMMIAEREKMKKRISSGNDTYHPCPDCPPQGCNNARPCEDPPERSL